MAPHHAARPTSGAEGVSASQFDLAVLGADDPLGGAVLQVLDEREVPVGRLFALSLREADTSVAFRGQDWPCEAADGFDFSQARALLVTSRSAAAERVAKSVRARHPFMPVLLAADIDPAPALAVARVLKALTAVGGAVSGDAFVALPAAYAGQDGLEELANQSRGLFNMESPEPEVFPLQIAFNLIPRESPGEAHSFEAVLKAATERLAPGTSVEFSAVWAPVFFGGAALLHARAASAVSAEAMRDAFRHRDDITLMEADLAAGTPTPATDAQGSESVFVGRILAEGRHARLWLVFDPLRMEAARMVDTVENWIDKPASSMLT